MSISRIEGALADLKTQLETITVANGYRNTVSQVSKTLKSAEQITDFPSLAIVFGEGKVNVLGDAKMTTFSEDVTVAVEGYVSSTAFSKDDNNALFDAAESLIHDLKVCLVGFITANLNTSGKRYMISGKDGIFKIYRVLPVGANKGTIGVVFTIRVHSQGIDFV